jgi:hypothetical protein
VNGGVWQAVNSVTVSVGATVNLGPQPLTGAWSWTGPNGFTSSSREIDGIPLSLGVNSFTATYTNPGGCTSTETFTITVTLPTATFTLTPVPPTFTPTSIPPTATFTDTPVSVGEGDLTVYYLAGVTSNITNSPHPQIEVTNSGTGPVSLNNVEVRYWFNCDCTTQTVQTWVDWAGLMPAGTSVTGDVLTSAVATTLGGQTDYVSYKFTGNLVLQPGQSIEIQSRFNLSDWSNMTQSNDWSFTPYTSFTKWVQITAYLNGSLIWGEQPVASAAALKAASVVPFPNPSTGGGVNLAVNLSGNSAGTEAEEVGESSIEVDPNAQIAFKVYTLSGRMIWSSTVSASVFGSSGNHNFYWDERDLAGGTLANGIYYVTVTVKSQGQSSVARGKILILK